MRLKLVWIFWYHSCSANPSLYMLHKDLFFVCDAVSFLLSRESAALNL